MNVCISVYRQASAALSIHVNMSKMPEGAVFAGAACAAPKKIGKLNEVTDVLAELPFKSSEGFKLNMRV